MWYLTHVLTAISTFTNRLLIVHRWAEYSKYVAHFLWLYTFGQKESTCVMFVPFPSFHNNIANYKMKPLRLVSFSCRNSDPITTLVGSLANSNHYILHPTSPVKFFSPACHFSLTPPTISKPNSSPSHIIFPFVFVKQNSLLHILFLRSIPVHSHCILLSINLHTSQTFSSLQPINSSVSPCPPLDMSPIRPV